VAGAIGINLNHVNTWIAAQTFAAGMTTAVFNMPNCSSAASPAVCGSSPAGSVAVPTGTNPTLVVDTTAVTAGSEIFLTIDQSANAGGATCNTSFSDGALTTLPTMVISARTAGTSFTISLLSTLATHPACVDYHIIN
jgi:hypothetical protein